MHLKKTLEKVLDTSIWYPGIRIMKSLSVFFVLLAWQSSFAAANDASQLYGTWTSKSNQVFTGPGFYDPVDELLIEPSLPGISYSFTEDGHFEQAIYAVTGNPVEPQCPSAALTFQHGTYDLLDNGTLILNPIPVDGRQLVSEPCSDNGTSSYNRYNQTTTFLSWYMQLDTYHGMYKLQLYQYDGSLLQPLYLTYKPPLMLPTETLNPTATSSSTKSTGNKKRSLRDTVKRNMENKHRTNAVKSNRKGLLNSDIFWYLSVGLIGVGSMAFLSS